MSSGRLFPLDFGHLPAMFFGGQSLRIEEYADGTAYVVRAEVPGVDPAKDIKVSVTAGRLQIKVERTEERAEKTHSEFHYGSFVRSVPLPPKASEDQVTAKYENGILEVRVLIAGAAPVGRDIPVEVPGSAT